ncbi:GCN5 family acetyltransferase [Sporosarcina globispora]|uniref:GCN5 family acetyltransferase n=1 Tax=Sporosarcina globispora TaxID=1459 RepID=A0A0M0GCZ3_SPOGL|nr:GNAT family N-acetyltransferase [Sporosarcina globispora]KON87714.1 GCN5 family acetyltransferase [Sporosarcina globispora]
MNIFEVKSIEEYKEGLSELLISVVNEGASIGFLPPLVHARAVEYWEELLKGDDVILFLAVLNGKIAGTIQLHLCNKENGSHRAEIAKLMTDPSIRRKGLGRLLLKAAEEKAQQEGRSLLVLDTREGDVSNILYQSEGYVKAGIIPDFAKSAQGKLEATVIYYKNLNMTFDTKNPS